MIFEDGHQMSDDLDDFENSIQNFFFFSSGVKMLFFPTNLALWLPVTATPSEMPSMLVLNVSFRVVPCPAGRFCRVSVCTKTFASPFFLPRYIFFSGMLIISSISRPTPLFSSLSSSSSRYKWICATWKASGFKFLNSKCPYRSVSAYARLKAYRRQRGSTRLLCARAECAPLSQF